jgi:hypothetical protein
VDIKEKNDALQSITDTYFTYIQKQYRTAFYHILLLLKHLHAGLFSTILIKTSQVIHSLQVADHTSIFNEKVRKTKLVLLSNSSQKNSDPCNEHARRKSSNINKNKKNWGNT